ncbi:TRAFAC clade GTPase domain-containing protein [Flavobacterium sp. C3NV]|uniref:TRAFAC clade GTPase domain-containing protein n=1 Tax=Flavobacterium sp. C3NV TaxID=3393358 RepID=UPI003990331D
MSEVKACSQEGCEIRKDGKCLEGLDSECPHFYWDDDNEDEEDISVKSEEASIINKVTNKINVFKGSELGLDEISSVTQRYECDSVIILGDLDCGKTTLLATIFDLFQIGQFKKYLFAGSLTQKGFEIRSHLSRSASGVTKADTERTKALDFRILHISIKDLETSLKKHFLLSDISGETIQLARGSGAAMKEQLGVVKLANHLIYIIDGEKLAGSERAAAIQDALVFIQVAIDNKIFDDKTVLNVLVSKWDLLQELTNFNLYDIVESKINGRFLTKLKEIKYRRIASRPEEENSTAVDLGFGLQDLITDFMTENKSQKKIPIRVQPSDRFINNYKVNENGK